MQTRNDHFMLPKLRPPTSSITLTALRQRWPLSTRPPWLPATPISANLVTAFRSCGSKADAAVFSMFLIKKPAYRDAGAKVYFGFEHVVHVQDRITFLPNDNGDTNYRLAWSSLSWNHRTSLKTHSRK